MAVQAQFAGGLLLPPQLPPYAAEEQETRALKADYGALLSATAAAAAGATTTPGACDGFYAQPWPQYYDYCSAAAAAQSDLTCNAISAAGGAVAVPAQSSRKRGRDGDDELLPLLVTRSPADWPVAAASTSGRLPFSAPSSALDAETLLLSELMTCRPHVGAPAEAEADALAVRAECDLLRSGLAAVQIPHHCRFACAGSNSGSDEGSNPAVMSCSDVVTDICPYNLRTFG